MDDPSPSTGDTDDPEQVLVAAARCGDREAVEALLRAHLGTIHAVCNRMCADRGDADDAAQNALISIVRGIGRFDGRSALSSWIYRITTNACLDELRRRRRRPEPIDATEIPLTTRSARGTFGRAEGTIGSAHADGSPEASVLAAETRRELSVALAELPEEFRVAVVLRDVADLDYASIAEITGVAIGTVRSRIARGRGRLADILDPGTGCDVDSSNSSERP